MGITLTSIHHGVRAAAGAAARVAKATIELTKTALKVAAVFLVVAAAQGATTPQREIESREIVRLTPGNSLDVRGFKIPLTEENRIQFNRQQHMIGRDYVDNVGLADVHQAVTWSIDDRGRPFLNIRLKCTRIVQGQQKISYGVATYFPHHQYPNKLVMGKHQLPEGCKDLERLDPMGLEADEFPEAIQKLLKGETVRTNVDLSNPHNAIFFPDGNYAFELATQAPVSASYTVRAIDAPSKDRDL